MSYSVEFLSIPFASSDVVSGIQAWPKFPSTKVSNVPGVLPSVYVNRLLKKAIFFFEGG